MALRMMALASVAGMSMQSVALGQGCEIDWFGLPGGLAPRFLPIPVVLDLHAWDDDGDGPNPEAVFIGGLFSGPQILSGDGILVVNSIAKWDGQKWSALGGGLHGDGLDRVYSMAIVDHDGEGPESERLYVGGWFERAGLLPSIPSRHVAAWDGEQWLEIGGGVARLVLAVEAFDPDGDGPMRELLVTGGSGGLISYDGESWDSVFVDDVVVAISRFDHDNAPATPDVLAFAGQGDNWIWDGSQVISIGGPSHDLESAMIQFDPDGVGPTAPMLVTEGQAFTPEAGWQELVGTDGTTLSDVDALVVIPPEHDEAGIHLLVAATELSSSLWAWDGVDWTPQTVFQSEQPFYDQVYSLLRIPRTSDIYPSGMYVGGIFEFAGGALAHSIAVEACDNPGRACLGDATGDLRVTMRDVTAILSDWGSSRAMADLNENGVVDFGDILGVLTTWGNDCLPTTLSSNALLDGLSDQDGDGLVTFADSTAQLATWDAAENDSAMIRED